MELINGMICEDENDRFDILQVLQHPWMKKEKISIEH